MFRRNRLPCAPQEVQQRLLREVYEEAMEHLNRVEAPRHYTWRLISDIKELRIHVSLEVSQRLLAGHLDSKLKAEGYRMCEGV